MTGKTATPPKGRATSARSRSGRSPARQRGRSTAVRARNIALVVVFVAGLIVALVLASRSGSSAKSYPFQVGSPGPGQMAPEVKLTATDGSPFDLSTMRGRNVLLYFQEGVGCQPCWDQITDIQHHNATFSTLGVDEIVTITTNPLADLRQKATDEGVRIPVLSDSTFAVSHAYHANSYGMMGDSADGHSFVLVGPDGRIRWRADYGGAPNYTMFVPTQRLAADMRQGMQRSAS